MWGIGLLKGLRNTMMNMMRGPITMQYPYQKYALPERARWAPVHLMDEDGNPKCTACMNCVRACPDGCIQIETSVDEDKNKTIVSYRWEMAACMLCGLCQESCPFDAIRLGDDYELAFSGSDGFFRTLLENVPAAKPKRAEKPAAPAAPKPDAAPDPAKGGDAS